jgi:2-methylcitrate dehydratase PrpD
MCGAALANAWIIDSIDIHDTGHYTKGHAGCALIPSLLACIHIYEKNNDNKKLNGKEFLTTLVVGYEIAYRAGHSLHVTVSDIHSSGSWVSLGCSAMLCRLLKLSCDCTAHALGIAEYYGPRSQIMRSVDYPTMLKDGLGQGALVGISSALLAQLGFSGSPAVTMTKTDDNQ